MAAAAAAAAAAVAAAAAAAVAVVAVAAAESLHQHPYRQARPLQTTVDPEWAAWSVDCEPETDSGQSVACAAVVAGAVGAVVLPGAVETRC